ncbi:acyltransferase family protein [Methylibium sp.]|uniref:acyltransferase family protein n=1 Tax=Methylibium sp. TaxID=2067992 RepID=UPI003D09E44B
MQFSKDINGLRAIAVVAVVLFHFSVPGLQGGFVGVDVFFVISGYLMTGIVIGRMGSGTFSVWTFYADRARRIVPALVVLCLALLAIGWFLLLPSDYKKLGKQVGGSLGFVSNILFWREAGYFDAVSHRKWLLHTWSLSVEWQFYLLYPLLLVALQRLIGQPRIRWALTALALCSLALSIAQSGRAPSASFYLLPTRTWEMLLGALVFLFPLQQGPRARLAMEAAGLALVGGSVVFLNPGDVWPGSLAILPTAGTALVIWSMRQASPLFDNRATQLLGRASYSIYLWHWPVVVGLTQLSELAPLPRTLAGIALSVLIGCLSFRFVETPTRHLGREPRHDNPRRFVHAPRALLAGLVVVAVSCGAVVWSTDGAPWRFAAAVRLADGEALNSNPYGRGCFSTFGAPSPPCVMGGDRKTSRAEMIGDSHAASVVTALAEAIPGHDGGVRFHGYASCPTLRGATYGPSENLCGEFNRDALSALGHEAPFTLPLVITNNWTSYLEQARIRFATREGNDGATEPFSRERYREELLATLCGLARSRRVYVTEPFPEFAVDVPRAVAYRLMRDPASADLTIDIDEHRRRNAFVLAVMQEAQTSCGVRLLDPTPYLCPGGRCMASLHGRPLYSDGHHLSEYGNRFLVPMFRQVYDDAPAAR